MKIKLTSSYLEKLTTVEIIDMYRRRYKAVMIICIFNILLSTVMLWNAFAHFTNSPSLISVVFLAITLNFVLVFAIGRQRTKLVREINTRHAKMRDRHQEIREYISHWLLCKKSWGVFLEGQLYWLELLENGQFYGRSDNIKGKTISIPTELLEEIFETTKDLV